ncbi:hypothetical protein KIN20_003625 [Parelaphostrongylus tenuis]|uniref:Uncharacterized protein n=1 Tax=Parelaphostrongylus tenuis TaxID=148309 RepID=A0AAD5QHH9_PARTN|nr:hypothetical protein KIN20_003625 [Parelaphostrongylus tenuis]
MAVGSCARTIPQARQAMCECIASSRSELKSKIASIYTVLNDLLAGRAATAIGSSNKVDMCVSNIKKHMITKVNDWVSVIDSAINTCVRKQQGQNLGLDAMLNVGCRKVFADTTGTATTQMKAAFEFINNLIDAFVERSGRFCGEHCTKS